MAARLDELDRKVRQLEERPVLREEKFIESTPKWLQAMISVATAVLLPTLFVGAAQLYGMHGDVRALQETVSAVQRDVSELKAAFGELQQSDKEQSASLARIEMLLTGRRLPLR